MKKIAFSISIVLQAIGYMLPAIVIDDMAMNKKFKYRRIIVTRRATIHKCHFHWCMVFVAGSMINVTNCHFTLGDGNWLIRKILDWRGINVIAGLQSA